MWAFLIFVWDDEPHESLRSSGSGKELVKAIGVEAFDDFSAGRSDYHQRRRRAAMVGFEQFDTRGGVTHVSFFEGEFPRLQKNLHHLAVEAAGLSEEENSVSHESLVGSTVLAAILGIHVFDLGGDLRGFIEHG